MKDTKKLSIESLQNDIVGFLKEKKGGIAVRSLNWWGPIRTRTWAFVAMFKGYFSFKEFCQLLLTQSFNQKLRLMGRYHSSLSEEFKKECPGVSDNCVNLYGQKFGGLNFYEVVELINEVIVSDQYHARQFLNKNSVVIDAGANIGAFSIFAAQLAPQGRIYSFEPVAETFLSLENNTKRHLQITCINSGLGERVCRKNIVVDSESYGKSILEDSPFYDGKPNYRKIESINVLTIDSFVEDRAISRVDFIKIDTEGYEARILNGARKTIKRDKPIIAMSAYHNLNDKEDLPRIIKETCPEYICELYKDHEEDFICYANRSVEKLKNSV